MRAAVLKFATASGVVWAATATPSTSSSALPEDHGHPTDPTADVKRRFEEMTREERKDYADKNKPKIEHVSHYVEERIK